MSGSSRGIFNLSSSLKSDLRSGALDLVLEDSRQDSARLLEETIYFENKRVERIRSRKSRRNEFGFIEEVRKDYLSGCQWQDADSERLELIKKVSDRYLHEIEGHFNKSIYRLATHSIPVGINLMMKSFSFRRFFHIFRQPFSWEGIPLEVRGRTEEIKKLSEKGTIILAPTHLSNLDSVILGYGIYRIGLPPFVYGAGLNLFKSWLVGFFMRNLGAYKVDRLKVHPLYKMVLKRYSRVLLANGFHSLFFPGGTRARSGSVEKNLKMGLLGGGLEAYIHNVQRGHDDRKVYVVPCNLNFHLTLEAETLVGDFLKGEGKTRYIISDDEFSKPSTVLKFSRLLLSLRNSAIMTIGSPLDPFGNRVDPEGVSIDGNGRAIDTKKYILAGDKPVHDVERDRNYTLELGRTLVDEFHRNNTVQSTSLLAFVMFEMISRQRPELDIYNLLRRGVDPVGYSLEKVCVQVEKVLDVVREFHEAGKITLVPELLCSNKKASNKGAGFFSTAEGVREIIRDACMIFSSYHQKKAVEMKGERLFVGDMKLLYFYRNRLVGYRIEDIISG